MKALEVGRRREAGTLLICVPLKVIREFLLEDSVTRLEMLQFLEVFLVLAGLHVGFQRTLDQRKITLAARTAQFPMTFANPCPGNSFRRVSTDTLAGSVEVRFPPPRCCPLLVGAFFWIDLPRSVAAKTGISTSSSTVPAPSMVLVGSLSVLDLAR